MEYVEVQLRSYPEETSHGEVFGMILTIAEAYRIADTSKNGLFQFLFNARILFRRFADTEFHSFSDGLIASLIRVP